MFFVQASEEVASTENETEINKELQPGDLPPLDVAQFLQARARIHVHLAKSAAPLLVKEEGYSKNIIYLNCTYIFGVYRPI